MDNKDILDEELRKAAVILDGVTLEDGHKMAYVLCVGHTGDHAVNITALSNCPQKIAEQLLFETTRIIKNGEPEARDFVLSEDATDE